MSYESDFKITFYNREDNERLSDQYSEFLMINRDGEVFELVHNGRGDYSPSYEGDWIGYKVKGNSKADEYESKAKAYDRVTEKLYARIDRIIMTSHPAQCKPGYVDGLYNALDIISEELEGGESE